MKTAIRRIVLLLALLSLSLYLVAGSPYQYTRYYYTDASRTVQCGEKTVTCTGSTHQGCYSSYYEDIYDAPCWTGGGTGGGGCTFTIVGGCSDGIDNDGDGYMDRSDPQCTCNSTSEF
jgi:hypothetical protein